MVEVQKPSSSVIHHHQNPLDSTCTVSSSRRCSSAERRRSNYCARRMYIGNSNLRFGKDLRVLMLGHNIGHYHLGKSGQPWTESLRYGCEDCLSQFRVAWLICVFFMAECQSKVGEGEKTQQATVIESQIPCEIGTLQKHDGRERQITRLASFLDADKWQSPRQN
jgi:hypothetical protein